MTSRKLATRQSDLFIRPRRPLNAGRLIGPKAPFKPKHIWAIRQQLRVARPNRDLAMFNCALDAKLRACDVVRLSVSDVAPGGALRQRVLVIQQKTGRQVPFELTEPARDAIATWSSTLNQISIPLRNCWQPGNPCAPARLHQPSPRPRQSPRPSLKR